MNDKETRLFNQGNKLIKQILENLLVFNNTQLLEVRTLTDKLMDNEVKK